MLMVSSNMQQCSYLRSSGREDFDSFCVGSELFGERQGANTLVNTDSIVTALHNKLDS